MSDVRLLYAGFSASETADALAQFPALWPRVVSEVDSLRAADLRANSERDVLAEQLATEDYLEALETRLTFSLDPRDDLARLRDLSAKTNQFNLAAARLDDLSIRKYLDAPDCFVVHVRLSDKLSDSGSVASLYLRSDRDVLIVDELCISCRAMGRMLEDCLITEAIRRVSDEVSFHVVRFIYTTAPRNMPARRWLAAFGANSLDSCGFVDVSWSPDRTAKYVSSMPIEIRWK
jgi:FkbH-like protein